jgi:glucokinase
LTSLFLGLDIGGTKSAAVVGDSAGNVIKRVAGPTPLSGWQEAVGFHLALINQVCHEFGSEPSKFIALGVSCGGPVDSRAGIVYSPPNLPGWHSVPLLQILTEQFDIPVALENDANATALAEHRWGAGVGCSDMAYLTFGTGIGAGLILNGELYRGGRDLAGEIGHTTIMPDGPLCLCGKRGCLEALASGTAIGKAGTERLGPSAMNAEDVCRLARERDEVAIEIIEDAAKWMGLGIANLLLTLNLQRVILGTMAVFAGDLLLEPIRTAAKNNCWPRVWEQVEIVPAALGEETQDKAALCVAIESCK